MNPRPASVTVISILGIIWSGFQILAAPCGLYFTFNPLTPNPVIDPMMKDTPYVVILCISYAINFIFAVCLLFCSIGSLQLKVWARRGMLFYAWGNIAANVAGMIATFGYVLPKMASVVAGSPFAHTAIVGGIIGACAGFVFAVALPIVILCFFTRTNVVNAFKGIFPADPTNFPVIYNDPPAPSQPDDFP